MITRLSLFLFLFASLFLNALFADTVKNIKTNEVIENVKTSENEQGILVEYEDGTKRGFKKETITIRKKRNNMGKKRRAESGNERRSLSRFELDELTLNPILRTSVRIPSPLLFTFEALVLGNTFYQNIRKLWELYQFVTYT
ncbi:hypothetical protein LEP1GSC062_1846 [Leptospira alexanderi serovar Manhao 3 str. L 60]|uniref:Uncharacterized protein n=1 Tax=Leptospira alexanderi serovar Manhao 3 str. L 60 TaxID=1049759 RepID=V6HVG1_9LEPT|nr:hypothetical protein LEP1GSC062_1846 [Leptospira alexanderi serovar Manhao 3 str. L 60]